jgi:hypothetical protein
VLKNAFKLLLHDREQFWSLSRTKLLARWCELWTGSGFYFQGRMDIDERSWWYNAEFVSANGGYLVPHDSTTRKVLPLEAWDTVRRDMIILLLRELTTRKIDGDLAELGVYRGYSARVIHHYVPERKFYLFDTFAGFDERDINAERTVTGREAEVASFSQTGVERALENIAPQNKNVQVFPGYFPGSVPPWLGEARFAFVHLDADLYEPILAAWSTSTIKSSRADSFSFMIIIPGPAAEKQCRSFFRTNPRSPFPCLTRAVRH